MDAADVDRGMLCAWYATAGRDDQQRRRRRRMPVVPGPVPRGRLGRPDPADGGGDRAAPLRGGVRVQGAADPALAVGLPPDDRRYYPLFAACCDLDITFCTQVGHAGPMRASEPCREGSSGRGCRFNAGGYVALTRAFCEREVAAQVGPSRWGLLMPEATHDHGCGDQRYYADLISGKPVRRKGFRDHVGIIRRSA
jgi:hypothetical protein